MKPQLEALLEEHKDLTLLRIDIDHWGSPVALQHGIMSLPHIELYDGKRLVSDNFGRIMTLLH